MSAEHVASRILRHHDDCFDIDDGGLPHETVRPPIKGVRSMPDKQDDGPAYSVGDLALTKRETEIAGLVSQGLGNKAVAGQLGVVEGTVKSHLHSIYRKLHVSNRTGLVLRVIANP
jgi:DNA-binding NarL/FixJ family response regulator